MLRKHINLNELDTLPNHVIIEVPNYVHMITPSAFNELFAPSINTLGEEAFRKKYKILCNDKFYEHMCECIDMLQDKSNWIFKY